MTEKRTVSLGPLKGLIQAAENLLAECVLDREHADDAGRRTCATTSQARSELARALDRVQADLRGMTLQEYSRTLETD